MAIEFYFALTIVHVQIRTSKLIYLGGQKFIDFKVRISLEFSIFI